MNELRTDAKMALARYESSYGAFGKDASFSMDDVYIVKDYINQLEAVADKFFDEIERLREALHEWDALIEYTYNGSKEAVSAMTDAAHNTAQILYGDPPWPDPKSRAALEDVV